MNIQITSVHFDADVKLKEFITARINKLTQFYDGIVTAEVFLKLSNTTDLENKITEIKLCIPGDDLFAKKQSKSFEESTDDVIEALRKQLLKAKDKLKN